MKNHLKPQHAFETRVITSLAIIFSCRMLGLFIILPVFALYAMHLKYATPTLIGFALGIYGLTQALLQIPLGLLSDRIGRKPVILLGLLVFIAGSVIAAVSTSIDGVIVGRALQGAGAIGSTILALLADLTKLEHRTKAMAMVGMSIGFSFMLAMIVGPAIGAWFGLSGLFWLTALLGGLCILLLAVFIPNSAVSTLHGDTGTLPRLFKSILKNPQLLRLDLSILSLHAILTATFIAIPISIKQLNIASTHEWIIYLPILLGAFLCAVPLIIIAEKKRKIRFIFFSSVILLGIAQLALYFTHTSLTIIALILFVFFTAFTALEAILPSWVSKIAPAGSKGTAIGIYSSAQFFGIFLGGILGGWIYSHYQLNGVFLFCAALAIVWLLCVIKLQDPPYLRTLLLNVGELTEAKAQQLSQKLQQVGGVAEVVIIIDEKVAYVKSLSDSQLTQQQLQALLDSQFASSH